ncbi:MAG TPA: tetratricopeptide repeat-containing glycosyltransferase family protein [Xanthobacteraceae bacterium]|nr:tetratricopeptide repeat-containing glycosyltransferase family protein [Xanthobacteraceae bacterium]
MSAPNAGRFDIGQSMNEAVALQRQGKLRDAEKIYMRVLKAAPDYFDALNLLGTVKAQLGRLGEAHRVLAAAVKINPNVPQGHANLGQVLHALKRNEEALAAFDKALALAPGDVAILNHRANALLSLGRHQEALAAFRQVLARVPQHPEARLNSGIAYAALGSPKEAVAEFDHALSIMPGHAGAHYNRGLALFNLGRHDDAIAAHDKALAAAPEHAGGWFNRGQALAALNRFEDAIASYARARALRKDNADVEFNEALALLTLGDYRRGFQKYESRWRRTGMPQMRSRGRPLWLGEYPATRKTVLVHAEQGLGDTIQFARYVPLLAEAGAKVVLEVQSELRTLMARLDGVAAILARGEVPPPFDVHCPLGSLPLAFKTDPDTVPSRIPYLAADDAHLAKWTARLGGLARPRIAIAWAGNASHVNDRNRSIAFARLSSLFAAPARFISIQRDVRSEDAAPLAAENRVMHVGAELEDFADTAAVIALADLVICVDTAVAHLAGAMGRPVWVLLPFNPDWRWTLKGDTSPWYPTARLFRQTRLGDWDGVIARVGADLAGFIAGAS